MLNIDLTSDFFFRYNFGSQDLSIHYLELPKLMKTISENHRGIPSTRGETLKKIEKWLYLIKEIDSPAGRTG
jgi:hypothetical protein